MLGALWRCQTSGLDLLQQQQSNYEEHGQYECAVAHASRKMLNQTIRKGPEYDRQVERHIKKTEIGCVTH